MIKYSDIHKAIVRDIKTKYGDITFSTDIEEGITRPSFFIELDNAVTNDFMREAMDSEVTCRIYYFPTTIDNNRIEIYQVMDNLNELFQGTLLEVNEELKIEIETIDFSVVDKVLHCYFDLLFSTDYKIIDDREMMENLEMENLELEG